MHDVPRQPYITGKEILQNQERVNGVVQMAIVAQASLSLMVVHPIFRGGTVGEYF